MSRNAVAGSFIIAAMAAALAVSLGAQEAGQQKPKPADPTMNTPNTLPAVVTVEGCLQREQDVPGRKPNVAEKAGVLEDYILTQAKVVKGAVPGTTASAAAKPGEAQPVGTSGIQPMYEVRGIEDDLLKKHVSQRVQIDGTIEPKDVRERQQTQAERGAATPDDLPEIQATAIRMIAGSCTGAQ